MIADHLDSPRVITNENGAVTTRKDYCAFGDEAITAQRTTSLNYDASETRKGYTGYEKDSESGLEFAQARYYNSQHYYRNLAYSRRDGSLHRRDITTRNTGDLQVLTR